MFYLAFNIKCLFYKVEKRKFKEITSVFYLQSNTLEVLTKL